MATIVSSIPSAKENLMFSYRADAVQVARERIALVPDQKRALFMAEKNRLDFVYNTMVPPLFWIANPEPTHLYRHKNI